MEFIYWWENFFLIFLFFSFVLICWFCFFFLKKIGLVFCLFFVWCCEDCIFCFVFLDLCRMVSLIGLVWFFWLLGFKMVICRVLLYSEVFVWRGMGGFGNFGNVWLFVWFGFCFLDFFWLYFIFLYEWFILYGICVLL